MLPLKRLHHLLGYHYPGVKLCTAVHPWVIQCAVVAFGVPFFYTFGRRSLSVEVKTLQFISPHLLCFFRYYCASTLLCLPLLLSSFSVSSFPSLDLSCLTSPLPPHPPTLPPYRKLLEEFYYSDLVSVNDEEPPTFHTLIFTFHTRVDNSLVEYLF